MTSQTLQLRYIESNPKVCHGKWVIRGTRILVSVIRQQIEDGMRPEDVIGEWRGKVSLEAIEEALQYGIDNPEVLDESPGYLAS